MPKSNRRPWLKALVALVGFTGLFCAVLTIAGRRFAERTAFSEINTRASELQENDNELITGFTKQLLVATAPEHRADIQQVISETKESRCGFICIDDSTKQMFSPDQRTILEKSLKAYYAQVFWGKGEIPRSLVTGDGSLKNGLMIGYSIKAYPGFVKLSFHSWSGFLSGGGHTKIYVWKGSGFRFHKQSETWIS